MSVFRVEKNKGYTVMSSHHLRNQALSLKAKGLLSQILSLPDDWDYTLQGLAQINKESIDAIREAVRELERAGYIVKRAFAVLALDHCQLAAQDFREERPFTASRFEKAGVYALRFLLYEVAHCFYFPLIGENLAVVSYSLFGFDLFFRHSTATCSAGGTATWRKCVPSRKNTFFIFLEHFHWMQLLDMQKWLNWPTKKWER